MFENLFAIPTNIKQAQPILVLLFWLVFFGLVTDGFSNITLEDHRREAIFKQQPSLLFLRTVDDSGSVSSISQMAISQHKVLITEFIYSQCKTLCVALGNTFQQVQTQILDKKLSQSLGLVSISFDVAHENTRTLQAYRKRLHANPQVWSLVRMQEANVLEATKSKLGLMVVQNNQQDFVHNSAFMVVASTGQVVGIFDATDISGAIDLALKQITLTH